MVISIDLDGTFSSDPRMFREMVRLMRSYGHTVIMITQRCEKFAEEVESIVQMPDLPIIYASGQSKEVAALVAGHDVQFWMDDNPKSVHNALVYRGCV